MNHRTGQVVQQVGEVIGIQSAGGLYQFVGLHLVDQAGTHLVVDLDEDFTLFFAGDQFPEQFTRAVRERFEQIADFRRVQAREQLAHVVGCAAVQRILECLQSLLDILLFGGFHALGLTNDSLGGRCAV